MRVLELTAVAILEEGGRSRGEKSKEKEKKVKGHGCGIRVSFFLTLHIV